MMLSMMYLYYTDGFMGYNFGPEHPMQPGRLMLTYRLMEEYGLLYRPDVYCVEPYFADEKDLLMVHDEDYLEAVKSERANLAFGLGDDDTPVFPGIYDASCLMAGSSIEAANRLIKEDCSAFNIGGGLHHAFRSRAAGFCVFNDPALAISVLKRKFNRVLYVDVDAHHADGVQSIFYQDPGVLTLSIHESGKYLFPGTGFIEEVGSGEGRGYSVNVPMPRRSGDDAYLRAFDAVVLPLFEWFRPDVVVAQLGVDAHHLDPLSSLNLTLTGFVEIVHRIVDLTQRHAGGRLLALGGGGYNMEVVPLAWTLAFQVMLDGEVEEELPAWWVDQMTERLGRPPVSLPDPADKLRPGDGRRIMAELDESLDGLKSILSKIHGIF